MPLGPVHPVWQDAVVIGALSAMARWHAQANPLLPLLIFGLVYLAGMTAILAFTRRWGAACVLGFLWPALILPGLEWAPRIVLLVAMAAVVWQGHRQSLKAFPWEFLYQSNPQAKSVLQLDVPACKTPGTKTPAHLGWPFAALSPKVESCSVSTSTSMVLSALVGWWCFCGIRVLDFQPHPGLILLGAIFAALMRFAFYCSGLATPFNLCARIATGRIVLPGFDRVFLTPGAVVLVAMAGAVVIRHSGFWYPVTESIVIALIGCVLLMGGPTLRNWVLTGYHRWRVPVGARSSRLAM